MQALYMHGQAFQGETGILGCFAKMYEGKHVLRQNINLLHSLHSICVCKSRLSRLIMKMLSRDSAQAQISSISDTMNYHSNKERKALL